MSSWNNRIEYAEQEGEFSYEDNDDANSWCECAVGERLEDLGIHIDASLGLREQDSIRREAGLLTLGHLFGHAVDQNDFDGAQAILDDVALVSEDRIRQAFS